MRKTDVRKWIHAVLDMLPLIVIPVFMVYSHRHTIDNYTLDVEETKVVNFNQQFDLSNFSTNGYGTITYNNDNVLIVTPNNENNGAWRIEYQTNLEPHLYLINYKYLCEYSTTHNLATNVSSLETYTNVADVDKHIQVRFSGDSVNIIRFYYDTSTYLSSGVDVTFKYLELFDLTLMFGFGNEPTIQEFNSWYSDSYYPYNTGTKELLHTGNLITYDSTDIGSQFFYALYNTTDNYFNFGNTFGFNNIYTWLEVNIFNGQAPLSVFVVWNIFLYEFLMDLIFLLYALFMFFIDFCTNLIERFYCSARGGR